MTRIERRMFSVGLMMIFSLVTASAKRKAFSSKPTIRAVTARPTSSLLLSELPDPEDRSAQAWTPKRLEEILTTYLTRAVTMASLDDTTYGH